MKVELTPTITNQKVNLLTKVKRFLLAKTKPIPNDTFEKKAAAKAEMEAYEKRRIVSRKHPNWCDAPEDGYWNNTVAERVFYYPEDIKKMESMTEDEAMKYRIELDQARKYYYDDNYHVDTPALDRVTKEYGVDLSKFVIKENK